MHRLSCVAFLPLQMVQLLLLRILIKSLDQDAGVYSTSSKKMIITVLLWLRVLRLSVLQVMNLKFKS